MHEATSSKLSDEALVGIKVLDHTVEVNGYGAVPQRPNESGPRGEAEQISVELMRKIVGDYKPVETSLRSWRRRRSRGRAPGRQPRHKRRTRISHQVEIAEQSCSDLSERAF